MSSYRKTERMPGGLVRKTTRYDNGNTIRTTYKPGLVFDSIKKVEKFKKK